MSHGSLHLTSVWYTKYIKYTLTLWTLNRWFKLTMTLGSLSITSWSTCLRYPVLGTKSPTGTFSGHSGYYQLYYSSCLSNNLSKNVYNVCQTLSALLRTSNLVTYLLISRPIAHLPATYVVPLNSTHIDHHQGHGLQLWIVGKLCKFLMILSL